MKWSYSPPFAKVGLDSQAWPDDSVLESALERYQVIKTGNANEVKAAEGVVAEKAPIDDQYDTIFQIGLNNWTATGIGQNHGQGYGRWGSSPRSNPRPKYE